jgi:hypothetical protein
MTAHFLLRKGLVLKQKINDQVGIPYSLNIAGFLCSENNLTKEENYQKALEIRKNK